MTSAQNDQQPGAPQPPIPRLVRFFVSGGLAVCLYFGVSYAFLHAGMPPRAAGWLSYAIAFSAGYPLQHLWTFSGRARHRRAFPRYALLQIGCAALSAEALRVGSVLSPASPLVTALGTTLLLGAVSYGASRWWVFADE